VLRRAAAAILACGAAISSVQAQTGLPDPTRPPAAVVQAMQAQQAGASAKPPEGPVLQSVIISPTGRSAIISGEVVTVGARYGEARVARITETEVVLRTGSSSETLRLYPEVDKKAVPAVKPAAVARSTAKASASTPAAAPASPGSADQTTGTRPGTR
jgi:MSHA biogenesis protein MshK